MNKQSNTYIVTYATILVVVVAAVLTFAAIGLQPMQQANVKIEKMGAILRTIGKGATDTVGNKDTYITSAFEQYIRQAYFVDSLGQTTDADIETALKSLDNLPEVFAAGNALPVFVATLEGGKTEYVVPMTGKGLWGAVWGYVALNADCNTIEGAVFDHKSETPGLGAEISTPVFQAQFNGKQIFNKEGEFVSIDLLKGAGSSAGNPSAVDAISGGTLTSNGVKSMLKACLGDYVPFFESIQSDKSSQSIPAIELVPATPVAADSSAAQITEGGVN